MESKEYVAQSLMKQAYYFLVDADFYHFHTTFFLFSPHLMAPKVGVALQLSSCFHGARISLLTFHPSFLEGEDPTEVTMMEQRLMQFSRILPQSLTNLLLYDGVLFFDILL